MNRDKHARLTPKGRALLVERVLDEGWTVANASQATAGPRVSMACSPDLLNLIQARL
jgi:hypothetical protein